MNVENGLKNNIIKKTLDCIQKKEGTINLDVNYNIEFKKQKIYRYYKKNSSFNKNYGEIFVEIIEVDFPKLLAMERIKLIRTFE